MRADIRTWMNLACACALLSACAPTLSSYQRGVTALDRGDEAAAREHFEVALSEPGDASRAQSQLEDLEMARVQPLERDQPDEAILAYERLIDRNPEAHRVRMRLGKLLVQKGEVDRAAAVLGGNANCKPCGQQLASMLAKRGRERLRANEWELARADLEAAVALEPSADSYLDIAQLFTLGASGNSKQASEAMVKAYPLLSGNAATQARWSTIRGDVVRACIRSGDFEGADRALEPEDPRVQESDSDRAKARVALRLEVAEALKGAGKIDPALERVRPIWNDASVLGLGEDPAIRGRVVDFFVRGVAAKLALGDTAQAAPILQEGMSIDSAHGLLRLQAASMVAAIDPKRAQEALDKISPRDSSWQRTQALIHIEAAFAQLDAGDIGGARKLIDRAVAVAPEALEVRLAQAHYFARTPFPGLSRKELKKLARSGKVNYADGKPLQYARALAELAWIDERWAQQAARRDPLRLASFIGRFTSLAQSLRASYPFKVRRVPGEEPRFIVSNPGKTVATVDVVGPGVDEAVELDPEAEYTFVFDEAGLIEVSAPEGEFSILVESYAGIDYAP
jgi:Tfp pilus assembly protein PilF